MCVCNVYVFEKERTTATDRQTDVDNLLLVMAAHTYFRLEQAPHAHRTHSLSGIRTHMDAGTDPHAHASLSCACILSHTHANI